MTEAAAPTRAVRVLVDVSALDRTFDYEVPAELAARVRVGTIVRVELHGRRVGGWVVEENVAPPAGVALRPIRKVTGFGPPPDVVALTAWAAWRWVGRRGAFLRAASPPGAVPRLDASTVATVPHPRAQTRRERLVRVPPAGDRWPRIAEALDNGPALLLAPSAAEADALAARIRRSGHAVALLPRDWARAAAGGTHVVGSRSGAWAPMPAIATIVILDAHDDAYVEERAPTWSAVGVARERAAQAGASLDAITPCPTIELLAALPLDVPPRPAERDGWPMVDIVDRRGDDPRTGLYSKRLVDLVRGGGRVLCVLNRKGRIKLLACAACDELTRCEHCNAAVEEADRDRLRCLRCGSERPRMCQGCGAASLRALRVGVSRAREELEALVGEPVEEVTTSSVGEPRSRVVVGTEAVLHRVRRADGVAFMDFDQELLAPRYRAGEQALALLARAGRITGPRTGTGRVLVQTRVPDAPALVAALHGDPARLADAERGIRERFALPPFVAMALVSGEAADEFTAGLAGVDVLGPHGDAYLIKAPDHDQLCTALSAAPRPPGRLRIDVDPVRA